MLFQIILITDGGSEEPLLVSFGHSHLCFEVNSMTLAILL